MATATAIKKTDSTNKIQPALGMGAIVTPQGVTFRVWAPNATKVSVIGSFDKWKEPGTVLEGEPNGYWAAHVSAAQPGDEYLFRIENGAQVLKRIDPYARQVASSVGNGVIVDPNFDWQGDRFKPVPVNELVIYELHVGTFNEKKDQLPGAFESITKGFDHLKALGVNALEIMPIAEFAGDFSWGYNPAHIFAVESSYGGPAAFKKFVRDAHSAGFAVILDVVYNHFGPSDLSLWQFDGWSQNDKGGIYFYNDWRAETPWGATRPDYGRGEVRQYIRDNAMMWVEEYHVDGLRLDMTLFMRQVRGDDDPGAELPEGWGLVQWINTDVRAANPNVITIAEDLRDNEYLTKPVAAGGAGFSAQWSAAFVHPLRDTVEKGKDEWRDLDAIRSAIIQCFNGDCFQRVVYSESHDEVANGKSRVPQEVSPDNPGDWYAQKRSTLAAAVVMAAPGIPMLFQGQEFLQPGWFTDADPLDWHLKKEHRGIVNLYRDLVQLRLNKTATSRGFLGWGAKIHHVNNNDKVIAWHRWENHGAGDDVIVVANFSAKEFADYRFGLPASGSWIPRLNSDWSGYSMDFNGTPAGPLEAQPTPYDGYEFSGVVTLAPYTVLIYSQDPQ